MKPGIVFPFSDSDGTMFPHLCAILPDLKEHFERAFVSIPKSMQDRQPGNVKTLQEDNFFRLFSIDSEAPVGTHFAFLYGLAAATARPEQILHLCYIDRLSFALRTDYRERFLADVDALMAEQLPLIFHRSASAWATHPKNYYDLENFATKVGQTLFDKELEYGWCHFAIQAEQLKEIMPYVKRPDMSMVAEMILQVQADVKTREVDWLAWEDPFILGRDATQLKRERENSLVETQKRLSYVLPIVELLASFSKNGEM